LFSKVAIVLIGGGVVLFAIMPFIKKLYTKPPEVVPIEPA